MLAKWVLPTPEEPAKRKIPNGLFLSFKPTWDRFKAETTESTASSWPITLLSKWSSKPRNFCLEIFLYLFLLELVFFESLFKIVSLYLLANSDSIAEKSLSKELDGGSLA